MNMRSIIIICFTLFSLNLSAQDYRLKAGDIQINAAVGLIPTYAADAVSTIVPPLSLNAEFFLSPNFALGLSGSYSQYRGEYVNLNAGITEYYETSTYMLGLRTAIHSNDLNNWRVYGGFIVGANIADVDKDVVLLAEDQTLDDELPSFSRPQDNSLLFSGFVGTRRTLGERLSVFGELGFGISLANLGLSYKF